MIPKINEQKPHIDLNTKYAVHKSNTLTNEL